MSVKIAHNTRLKTDVNNTSKLKQPNQRQTRLKIRGKKKLNLKLSLFPTLHETRGKEKKEKRRIRVKERGRVDAKREKKERDRQIGKERETARVP